MFLKIVIPKIPSNQGGKVHEEFISCVAAVLPKNFQYSIDFEICVTDDRPGSQFKELFLIDNAISKPSLGPIFIYYNDRIISQQTLKTVCISLQATLENRKNRHLEEHSRQMICVPCQIFVV